MSLSEAELVARYLAGELDADQEAEVHARLATSDEFLHRFTRTLVFEERLREAVGSVLHPAQALRPVTTRRPRRAAPRARRAQRRRSAPALILTASALLVLALGFGWWATRAAAPDAATGPSVLASVAATAEHAGRSWTPVRGEILVAGTSLHTAEEGSLALRYADGSVLRLHAASRLRLAPGPGKRLGLDRGRLQAEVAPQPAGRPLVVATPTATATVLGTVLELRVAAEGTTLQVERGRVALRRRADDRSVVVAAGQVAADADLLLRRQDEPVPAAASGTQPLLEAEALVAAPPADAALHAGRELRPYREPLPGASGGACIALPGEGTELAVPVPARSGQWWLWIRYRDEDIPESGLPSFEVVVDGEPRLELRVPGGSSRWLWARVPIVLGVDSRVALRSTFAGTRHPESSEYPYRAVNRIDALRFTDDPGYDPAVDDSPTVGPGLGHE